MIHSLFIIANSGEIIVERHYKGRLSRSVGEQFVDEMKKSPSLNEVPPIVQTSSHFLINIHHNDVFFVGVIDAETPPLMITELLHRIVDIIKTYITTVTEGTVKANFAVIYQVLDEMIDNGFPLTTEISLLHDLVRPPVDLVKTLSNAVGQPSQGTGRSAVPWRKTGIRYVNNEVFFDIVEEINCIVDVNGMATVQEVVGHVNVNCRLSGMPDLLLTFKDPSVLEDVSLHPCVRYAKFEQDRCVSFVPPDGEFELMSYRVTKDLPPMPFYCRPQLSFYEGGCNLNIMAGLKAGQNPSFNQGNKTVEDMCVHVPTPCQLDSFNVTCNTGQILFDAKRQEIRWDVGKMNQQLLKTTPSANGRVSWANKGAALNADHIVNKQGQGAVRLTFKVDNWAYSNIKVDQVQLRSENYKPFKGVKYLTKQGRFEVRTL